MENPTSDIPEHISPHPLNLGYSQIYEHEWNQLFPGTEFDPNAEFHLRQVDTDSKEVYAYDRSKQYVGRFTRQ